MTRQTAIQTTNANPVPAASSCECDESHVETNHANSWSYIPAIDVLELAHEYRILVDAPGVSRSDIQLSYENGVVSLHGRVEPRFSQDHRFLRQEYGVGDFDRTIPLGRLAEFVDADRIAASYSDGVLTIVMPKLEQAKPRTIAIKGG